MNEGGGVGFLFGQMDEFKFKMIENVSVLVMLLPSKSNVIYMSISSVMSPTPGTLLATNSAPRE